MNELIELLELSGLVRGKRAKKLVENHKFRLGLVGGATVVALMTDGDGEC